MHLSMTEYLYFVIAPKISFGISVRYGKELNYDYDHLKSINKFLLDMQVQVHQMGRRRRVRTRLGS